MWQTLRKTSNVLCLRYCKCCQPCGLQPTGLYAHCQVSAHLWYILLSNIYCICCAGKKDAYHIQYIIHFVTEGAADFMYYPDRTLLPYSCCISMLVVTSACLFYLIDMYSKTFVKWSKQHLQTKNKKLNVRLSLSVEK